MTARGAGVENAVQPVVNDPLSPEHAHGFSSLSLLAGSEQPGRILYLLRWSGATVAVRGGSESRSRTLAVDGWSRLPLMDGAVDAVVADLDAVPDTDAIRWSVAAELRRILKSQGRCILAVTHRRRPRDARTWSRYRLVPPLSRWLEPLAGAGLGREDAALLRFDGARITDIHCDPSPLRGDLPGRAGDAVALVQCAVRPTSPSVLAEVRRTLDQRVGIAEGLDQVHVRKIGKTAAFVSDHKAHFVVRLPCSPVALARAKRNYAALLTLHETAPCPLDVVPRPIDEGSAAGQRYFVETRVPGLPREGRVDRLRWEPQAIEFITVLHASTARPRSLSEDWFESALEPALSGLQRTVVDAADREAIDGLRATLRRRLVGQRLPFVRSHGDYTGSNCLYDSRGSLRGVVDWELSSADTLPLLDLLQCFDLPAEYTSDGRWHRAEVVFDGIEGRGPLYEATEIVSYMRVLGLSRELLPPLLLAYWVDHAGARALARASDRPWFQKRVEAPLRRWRAMAWEVL